ncbi:MAG: hypothetical protein TR69_WS6001001232 [candidate division WS6 bacterium OLB20]|uniref:Uncharacterized protein n=1 Tax=candidate division WS6 bacterium OLB20 TaxID=1617426 RepID=A0A136LXA7_9BACT|nr:MAG: hypothetical protein TR69_WS6001001232 [candidate division WS6 bacterium OLB20]
MTALAFTDMVLGSAPILLFTWTGFAAVFVIANTVKARQSGLNASVATALAGTILFYLWTNLGVVLVGGLYPPTFDGLASSYINAVPFLRNQLAGNLVIVPMLIMVVRILTAPGTIQYQAVASSGAGEVSG